MADLKDIASISGKGGLFKVVKPTRTGVILETIDEHKNKVVGGGSSRISLLKEISIYTTGAESSTPLENVFDKIYQKHGKDLPLDNKASNNELTSFLESVLPEFDKERVYTSDIKKLVTWYGLISKFTPEKLEAASVDEAQATEEGSQTIEKEEKGTQPSEGDESAEIKAKPKAKAGSAKKA